MPKDRTWSPLIHRMCFSPVSLVTQLCTITSCAKQDPTGTNFKNVWTNTNITCELLASPFRTIKNTYNNQVTKTTHDHTAFKILSTNACRDNLVQSVSIWTNSCIQLLYHGQNKPANGAHFQHIILESGKIAEYITGQHNIFCSEKSTLVLSTTHSCLFISATCKSYNKQQSIGRFQYFLWVQKIQFNLYEQLMSSLYSESKQY